MLSRRAGSATAARWESDGAGEFTIANADRAGRGTDVVLHLKAGDDELLSGWKLKSILTHYSDHIATPIRMAKEEWDKDANDLRRTGEVETVNRASALWTRPKSDISDEQYREFYKHVAHDPTDPLAWTHNRVEGRSEYIQLLYLPRRAPFDLWDRKRSHGLKLYVRRVFIMDDAEQLLPTYLRFTRGVVDSSDLPLNVSREILQESRDVKTIREGCAKRVLALLEDLAQNRAEDYATFWQEFGAVLKEGVGEDPANAARIAGLLRFASTATIPPAPRSRWPTTSARMKTGQTAIYYVTADTAGGGAQQPAPGDLPQEGRRGAAADRPGRRVDALLPDRIRRQAAGIGGQGRPVPGRARRRAGEGGPAQGAGRVQGPGGALSRRPWVRACRDVRVTLRLTESPACVVVDKDAMSAHLQRLLRASGQAAPPAHRSWSSIRTHPLVRRLSQADPGRRAGRMGRPAARPGHPRRGRAARRSGAVRQAHEPALLLAGAG